MDSSSATSQASLSARLTLDLQWNILHCLGLQVWGGAGGILFLFIRKLIYQDFILLTSILTSEIPLRGSPNRPGQPSHFILNLEVIKYPTLVSVGISSPVLLKVTGPLLTVLTVNPKEGS